MSQNEKHLLKALFVSADKKSYDSVKRLTDEFHRSVCQIKWAKSVQTALKLLTDCNYDVCLIDYCSEKQIDLPFVQEISRISSHTPILLLTCEEDRAIQLEAMRNGAVFCLDKATIDGQQFEKNLECAVERVGNLSTLHRSVDKFRNLVETLPVMIYVVEPKPPYLPIYISPAFEAFGYSLEDWNSCVDFWVRLLHPEDKEWVLTKTEAAMKSGSQTDFEYRIVTKNGDTRWVHDRGYFVRDAIETVVCWQGVILDITARKQALEALAESETRYRELFEKASDGIYTRDVDGNFTSVNRACELILGYKREELLKMNIGQIIAPDYAEKAREMFPPTLDSAQSSVQELVVIAKDGQRLTVEINTRLIVHNEKIIGIQGIARNISERKLSEEALISSELRYRLLGEGIKHHVWTARPDGSFDYANARTLAYFGQTLEEITSSGMRGLIHPDDLSECYKRWSRALKTGEDYEMEHRLRRHDGEYRWHKGVATAAFDGEGNIIKWFGTNSDMNDKKLAEAQLNYNALHDTLTNLPNRVKFMNHLQQAIHRVGHHPSSRFAVLFLDLDRFKLINDSLGHSVGDKLLIAIGARLETCVRPGDIVARLGGDEFTLLLFNVSEISDAVQVTNRILEKLSLPFQINGYEVFTSASVGVIVSDEVSRLPEDFLRDADTAMYRAKETGKARYEIFDREMHIRNMNLLQLENDLRKAIEQEEFRVYYQPIVQLDSGQTLEFEALIRWQHPKHGLVSPDHFIGMAEETGLIIPIGEWILREACRQVAEWNRDFPLLKRLSISVNLSAKQLMHPDLIVQVKQILEQTGLDPHCLKLEVTESIVLENSDRALVVMAELHALNISLTTDDFGTGYSSLSYLHRFPFDCLKIDRSFVSKMNSDQKSEAIVRTILLLAQNLNIKTVAEGIETAHQLKSLRELGCQTGQGYLFSKPVSVEVAEEFLRNGLPHLNDDSFSGFDKKETINLLESNEIH